jgi:tetratricopeptide (TPR) repeat protein
MTRHATMGLAVAALLSCATRPALPPPPEPLQLEELDLGVQRLFRSLADHVEAVRHDERASRSVQAAAYGELGAFHLANGFLGAAEACFRAAIALEPSSGPWLSYRAHTLYRQGRLAEARSAFAQRLARDPADLATLLWVVETSLEAGDLASAGRMLATARQLAPDNPLVHVGLAHVRLGRHQPQEALEELATARALGASSALTSPLRARAERRLGTRATDIPESGALSLREGIELSDPLLADLARFRVGARQHDLRAQAAESEGQLDLALIELKQAIATDPDRIFARLDTAEMLLRLGRPLEARAELAILLEKYPAYPPALARTAEVEDRLGNAAAAEALFERALDLDPLAPAALLAFGDLLARTGRCAHARGLFDRALSLDPGSELAAIGLGRCDIEAGRPEHAARRLEDLIGARAGTPTSRLLLARLLALPSAAQDPARALFLAEEVHGQYGDVLPVLETLAMAQAAAGDFVAAARLAAEAVAGCPDPACRERAADRLQAYEGRRLPPRAVALDEPLSLARP